MTFACPCRRPVSIPWPSCQQAHKFHLCLLESLCSYLKQIPQSQCFVSFAWCRKCLQLEGQHAGAAALDEIRNRGLLEDACGVSSACGVYFTASASTVKGEATLKFYERGCRFPKGVDHLSLLPFPLSPFSCRSRVVSPIPDLPLHFSAGNI